MALFGFFVLAAIATTYPVILHLRDAVPGMPHTSDIADPLLAVYLIDWTAAHVWDPSQLLNPPFFHPNPGLLAQGEPFIGLAPLSVPIRAVFGDPLLTYNVVFVLSFALSGFFGALLAWRLTGSVFAGLVAGIVFGFAPFRHGALAHILKQSSFFMPLALLLYHRWSTTGRRTPLLACALVASLQALSTWYYGLYLFGALATFEILSWWSDPSARTARRAADLASGGAVCVGLVGPIVLLAARSASEAGLTRSPEELASWAGELRDLLAVPSSHRTLDWVAPIVGHSPLGQYGFPGVAAALLILVGIAFHLRKGTPARAAVTAYALLAVLACTMVWGPFVASGGKPVDLGSPAHPVWIPTPYWIPYSLLPAFRNLRDPSRIEMLVILCAAVLAGFGAARFLSFASSRRWAGLGGTVCLAAVCVEMWHRPISVYPVPAKSEQPAVYRQLAELADRGAVLELGGNAFLPPRARDWNSEAHAMYFSLFHGRPVLNGWTAHPPWGYAEMCRDLHRFPDAPVLAMLGALGARYVVVRHSLVEQLHRAGHSDRSGNSLRLQISTARELEIVAEDRDVLLVRIRAGASSMAAGASLRPHVPSKISAASDFLLPIIFEADKSTLGGDWIEISTRWMRSGRAVREQHHRARTPLWLDPGRREAVSVRVAAPSTPGRYSVEVSVTGRLESRKTRRSLEIDVLPDGPLTDPPVPEPSRLPPDQRFDHLAQRWTALRSSDTADSMAEAWRELASDPIVGPFAAARAAHAFAALRRFAEAEAVVRRAAANAETRPFALLLTALILEALGRYDESEVAAAEYVSLAGYSHSAAALLERLDALKRS